MKSVTLNQLPKEDRDLVLAARHAADNAYAPYSGFAVGAAARSTDGKVHVGANLENASTPRAHSRPPQTADPATRTAT